MTTKYTLPTLPTAPTLASITVPAPISIAAPSLPALDLTVETLDADSVTAKLTAWTYARYGATIQDVIDGKVEELLDWDGNNAIDIKAGIVKEQIAKKANDDCREILRQTAARGFPTLPGPFKKMIYDVEMAAKLQLSDEYWKLFIEQIGMSQEMLAFALQAGAEKEAAMMQHHNRIQMANLDAAVSLAKFLYEVYQKNAEAYNLTAENFSLDLKNHQAQRELKLSERSAYIVSLQSLIARENKNSIEAELFATRITMADLDNGLKLLNLKLQQITNDITKTNIQTYHAQLQEYLSKVEVILNDYKNYRSTVKGKIAEKDTYIKNLKIKQQEIKYFLKQVDQEKQKSRADLITAKAALSAFENSIKEFSATVDKKKLENEVLDSDYANTLLSWTSATKTAIENLSTNYRYAVSSLETGTMANLQLNANVTGYNADIYRAQVGNAYTLASSQLSYYADVYAAAWAARENTKAAMELAVIDQTST